MKRKAAAFTMCIAMVLLLGLSQCKKQETPNTPTPEETEEGIHITLDVDDGGRHVVNPDTDYAYVNYSFGDKIYVGDGSRYIGTLTNTGSTGETGSHFEGTILSPSSETLHFYFVGGLETGTLTKGSTTSFAVDISDQSSNLPVLSYGNAPYAKDATLYSCRLENKCGLVKFKLASNTMESVSVAGMLTQATISFNNTDNPIVPIENQSTGNITLYSENERTKWAIMLPQESVNQAEVTIGSDVYVVKVPQITNSAYTSIINETLVEGGDIIYNCPVFFVNNEKKLVTFSKGNLQYQAYPTPTWRFAENQWDFVGNNDNNNTMSSTSGNWIDLFGWGTWGSNGNPLNISAESEDYSWSEFTDPLDDYSDWRTLSDAEWTYLIGSRPNAGTKYGWATVNGVQGVVILPENWELPTGSSFTSGSNSNNTYDSEQWSVMENAGALFLPAAGNRTVTTETTTEGEPPTTITTTTINVNNAGSNGYYWTFTADSHKYFGFNSSENTNNTTEDPTFGCSVRLVRDIE